MKRVNKTCPPRIPHHSFPDAILLHVTNEHQQLLWKLGILLTLTALVFLFSDPCLAETIQIIPAKSTAVTTKSNPTDTKEEDISPRAKLREEKSKVRRLNQGIEDHKSKIQDTRKKERSLLEELEEIDGRLQAQSKKLSLLREKLARQENLLVQKQENLNRTIAEKETLKRYVQKRLTAYYQMGSIGLMNVIFSREKLSELLNFQEYFRNMIRYDQAAIASYQSKIVELNQSREILEAEKNRLSQLVDQVTVEEEALSNIHNTKMALLNRIKTEKKLYQQAVKELEMAAANLRNTLEKLKKRIIHPPAIPANKPVKNISATPKKQQLKADKGFASQKGKLDPPVDGTMPIQLSQPADNSFGITSSKNGIDILTASDQAIKAVYDGMVINSGYMRGYGNMIIIDHGQNYYSVVSRAAEILKKEGDTVMRGDVIGITGDDSTLLGQGLHFEIRRGSEPEDPLQWIRKDAFADNHPPQPSPPKPAGSGQPD